MKKLVGKRGYFPTTEVPFSCLTLDHVTIPAVGFKYILNVVDLATCCIVSAAVQTTSTRDMVAHLRQIFYKFRAADHILSSHGPTRISQPFKLSWNAWNASLLNFQGRK